MLHPIRRRFRRHLPLNTPHLRLWNSYARRIFPISAAPQLKRRRRVGGEGMRPAAAKKLDKLPQSSLRADSPFNALRSHPILKAICRRALVNMSHVIAACKANLEGEAEQHAANHSGAGLRPLMVIFLSATIFWILLDQWWPGRLPQACGRCQPLG